MQQSVTAMVPPFMSERSERSTYPLAEYGRNAVRSEDWERSALPMLPHLGDAALTGEQYAWMLDLMTDVAREYVLFLVNYRGDIASWNQGAERLFGYSTAEILGQNHEWLYTPEERTLARPQQALDLAYTNGRTAETALRRKSDGSVFIADVTIARMPRLQPTIQEQERNAQRESLQAHQAFVVIVRDATEMMRVLDSFAESEAQLRLMTEQAQHIEQQAQRLHELNGEKDELLRIVAHDLKNPLTSIALITDVVKLHLPNLSAVRLLSQVDAISTTVQRMQDIIHRLLELNALEGGNFSLEPYAVDVSSLIHSVVTANAMQAHTKSIAIMFFPPPEPCLVYADRVATLQVLDNLISNAVKYSFFGTTVSITLCRTENAVQMNIMDEGPGLTETDKGKMFGTYTRLSAQPTGGEHSTGLGLSIAKKLVEAMNGSISCESEYGRGATFSVVLPAA